MKFSWLNFTDLHSEKQSLVFNLNYTMQTQLKIVQWLQANFVMELTNTKNPNNIHAMRGTLDSFALKWYAKVQKLT